jgi:hypothetical protein
MSIKSVPQFKTNKDELGEKREEKVQKQFKQVLAELVQLLRTSTDTETVYLYWVNKYRGQFVLESVATRVKNTVFEDRINFSQHFLESFIDLTDPIIIEVGKHISVEQLTHYFNSVPVRYLTILPFINNGETVALTVLESKFNTIREDEEEAIDAYNHALGHLLHTYMELADLSENQAQWPEYQRQVEHVLAEKSAVYMIHETLALIQHYLKYGSVSFLTRNLDQWNVVAHSEKGYNSLPLGIALEEQTLANEALYTGKPQFAIHINGTPWRVNPSEPQPNGASFAIPLLVSDRRQGVFLLTDENPLVFNESTKFKITNAIQLISMKLESARYGASVEKDFFSVVHGLLDPDFWRATLITEIRRAKLYPKVKTYFGFMTIGELHEIRSKLRLDSLQQMQYDLVRIANPSALGLSGLLGQFSDYVYAFIIQGADEQVVGKWVKAVTKILQRPMVFKDNSSRQLRLHFGYTLVKDDVADEDQLISEAKTALSHALKNPDVLVFEY